jgi:DMSO/TMAO reductase YedYZ molybdopterin-dependent catalytic subunit
MLGKFFSQATPDQRDRVPPGQHLANGFPVLTYGDTPVIPSDDWSLSVWGLTEPKSFSWDDLMAMPQQNFTADFHCVTRWSKLDVQWTGFKVTDFMQGIQLDPTVKHVMQHCYGGYTTNVALDDFLRDENFFAHILVDQPLPAEHGGPMRLVIPHLYAWKSAKWINGLEFLSEIELGFWERNGYHRRGEPWAEERFSED